MLLNRSKHIPWVIFVIGATLLAWVLYVANYYPGKWGMPAHLPHFFGPTPPVRVTRGGTPLGLIFGIVSFAIFLIAAGLGIRKKRRTWPIGHVQMWMRAHIWLTILTIPLILFHCGFHFGGFMTTALMVLYFVVMVSGFYGLAMQQFIPRLMTQTIPHEVVYEQIPHIRRQLLANADAFWKELSPLERKEQPALAAAGHGPAHGTGLSTEEAEAIERDEQSIAILARFLHDQCYPYLRADNGSNQQLASDRLSDETFRVLRLNVSPRWQVRVDAMQQWCTDRRRIDRQARMQHYLHWWLLVHVPLSFALIVITIWHIYVTVIFL